MNPSAVPLLDALAVDFLSQFPDAAAVALQDLDSADAAATVAMAPPRNAAAVLARLGPDAASDIVRKMAPGRSSALLAAAEPAMAAALLNRLAGDVDRQAVLKSLPASGRREIETFLTYPENSAGMLMDPAAPVFRDDAAAGRVAETLRAARRFSDEVVIVTDQEGRLLGTVSTVEILLAPREHRLRSLRIRTAPSVEAFAPQEEVVDTLERQRTTAMPVVDLDGRPVGVISQRALARVAEQDVAADMQTMVGASRDERALSSVSFAVRKRLPWLQINLATAFLAAAVVGLFEETIARFTALAVLLPVVAGQSGNTGAQSLAVTMRGLTLHEIGLRHWLPVAVKESTVGFLNGVAVALVTMGGVQLWSGSLGLTLVIGTAMVLSMTIAGVAGAAVPMLLRATGQDPAQSSSIILTTVTDVVGFFSFLGLAAMLSAWL